MPKGYWVAKANILDDKKLSRYGKQAEIAIEKFRGKFLVCLLYTSDAADD